ncbi:restriction endonuclease subunit S [uncultured Polaribacter sp.]|uniref:restriction endonuclease subunit S n=1 Tax=uncultured Polaribacter sp. TaxID=174711 RepID=UPI00263391F3|nr:restriction endonuclease subunit S [uncultured Polaribacter sp.]
MTSNYKKLGQYIKPINIRNKDLKVKRLLGVSIRKVLMPSIANTVGTNMKTYKIIKKHQFAYGPVTSRNGDKISIALLEDFDEAIISQAYVVFEIIDTKLLNPEYLMMWFRRPEFDRYARYKSHGSVREIFDWEELCDTELPIPSIEKQKEIVKEYNIVVNRIQLNEKLNQKLEETAQALYKHWFVDFEFPNKEGKPYKSSGGEMVYNEELDMEIPKGWSVETIKDFCLDMKSGGTPSRTNVKFWNNNDVPWLKTGEIKNNIILSTKEFISSKGLQNSSAKLLPINTVLMSMYGANAGEVGLLKIESSTNQACCGMICKDLNDASFLYYHLVVNQKFNHSQAIGGAQQNLSKDYIENIKLVIPKNLNTYFLKNIIENKENNSRLIMELSTLKQLLLARMTKG